MKKPFNARPTIRMKTGDHRDTNGNVIMPEVVFMRLMEQMEIGSCDINEIIEQTRGYMKSKQLNGTPLHVIMENVSKDFAVRAFLMKCVSVDNSVMSMEHIEEDEEACAN